MLNCELALQENGEKTHKLFDWLSLDEIRWLCICSTISVSPSNFTQFNHFFCLSFSSRLPDRHGGDELKRIHCHLQRIYLTARCFCCQFDVHWLCSSPNDCNKTERNALKAFKCLADNFYIFLSSVASFSLICLFAWNFSFPFICTNVQTTEQWNGCINSVENTIKPTTPTTISLIFFVLFVVCCRHCPLQNTSLVRCVRSLTLYLWRSYFRSGY